MTEIAGGTASAAIKVDELVVSDDHTGHIAA